MSVHLIIQTTKGIIRDQQMRRGAMFVLMVAALLMAFVGATFLNTTLIATPWMFLLFWAACAWLTLTASLLAIFDLLAVRMLARQEQKRMRREIFGNENPGKETDDEDRDKS